MADVRSPQRATRRAVSFGAPCLASPPGAGWTPCTPLDDAHSGGCGEGASPRGVGEASPPESPRVWWSDTRNGPRPGWRSRRCRAARSDAPSGVHEQRPRVGETRWRGLSDPDFGGPFPPAAGMRWRERGRLSAPAGAHGLGPRLRSRVAQRSPRRASLRRAWRFGRAAAGVVFEPCRVQSDATVVRGGGGEASVMPARRAVDLGRWRGAADWTDARFASFETCRCPWMSRCHEVGNGMHTVPGWEAHESHGRAGTGNGAGTQRTLQRSKASRSSGWQPVTARGHGSTATS